jgi:hypothetical protein
MTLLELWRRYGTRCGWRASATARPLIFSRLTVLKCSRRRGKIARKHIILVLGVKGPRTFRRCGFSRTFGAGGGERIMNLVDSSRLHNEGALSIRAEAYPAAYSPSAYCRASHR